MDDFSEIQAIASGFRQSRILLAAHKLGIFQQIGEKRVTAAEIARGCNASLRGITILLDALAALGMVHKEEESYRNSASALRYLCPESPEYRGPTLDHWHSFSTAWLALEEAVIRGSSPQKEGTGVLEDPQRNQLFIRAMADIGRPWAQRIAQQVDLTPYSTVLDLGGGPGVYAMELLRQFPHLQAILADLPITLESAREFIAESGLAHRITPWPVDFFQESPPPDLGRGWDVALISNVLHVEGIEKNRLLLQRLYAAMRAPGLVIIHEGILDPERISPPDRALFAVHMLINTQRGNSYTQAEICAWLAEAGFVQIHTLPAFQPPSVIIAHKVP